MGLLKKLAIKLFTLAIMAVLMGVGLRYARPYLMKSAGLPEGMPAIEAPKFSSGESELMGTVLKSAMRLVSGSATRTELAGELSDKLYSGRADADTMSELNIELVKPGGGAILPEGSVKPGAGAPASAKGTVATNLPPTASAVKIPLGAKSPATARTAAGQPSAERPSGNGSDALLTRLWAQAKANSLELTAIPAAFIGMFIVQRLRRRSRADEFAPANMAVLPPPESEAFEMTHAVNSLTGEDFELLVALIYQRQGYRVSMPNALGSGRGGDFMLLRKSERLLVQCKKISGEQKVPVERLRELHEAATAAGATRGMYVTCGGFTWDARNFAKSKGMTAINARTLDALITAARETPEEDLLAVSQWAQKLMSKVQLTPPLCPACEAAMEQLSEGTVSGWVCSQRPECRGRRNARKQRKPASAEKSETAPAILAAEPPPPLPPVLVAPPRGTHELRVPQPSSEKNKIASAIRASARPSSPPPAKVAPVHAPSAPVAPRPAAGRKVSPSPVRTAGPQTPSAPSKAASLRGHSDRYSPGSAFGKKENPPAIPASAPRAPETPPASPPRRANARFTDAALSAAKGRGFTGV